MSLDYMVLLHQPLAMLRYSTKLYSFPPCLATSTLAPMILFVVGLNMRLRPEGL